MPDEPDRPRAVLIDLDDTLVPWQTVAHWQWAWKPQGPLLSERHVKSVLRHGAHDWDRERWQGLVGRAPPPDAEAYRQFLARTLTGIADRPLPDPESEAVVARFLKPANEPEVFSDALPLLRTLEERGVRVGVVSTLPAEVALWALHRAGIAASLLVASADDPEPRLPRPPAFRTAAERLGSKARETLFIGDLFWSDVRAGGRAGLTSVLIDRAKTPLKVQWPRIHSLAEVPNLLDRPVEVPKEPTGDEPAPLGP